MSTRTYTTLSGRELNFEEPTGAVAAFLARVEAAAADPRVSEDALIALVYSAENPILDTSLMPGRGTVTPRVFADPLYHVMTDIIGRVRVREGRLDLEKTAARYTMTPAEAADQLGVHVSAVRQAIDRWTLPAWKKGGRWFLDPKDVANYQVSQTGPKPVPTRAAPSTSAGAELSVRIGRRPEGTQFLVKVAEPVEVQRERGNILRGTIKPGWRRIGVLAALATKARFFVLEPAETEERIDFEGFSVQGRFRVVEKENNAERARAAFKAFEAK